MKWTWITPYEFHKMAKEASDAAHKAFMVAFRQALKGGGD